MKRKDVPPMLTADEIYSANQRGELNRAQAIERLQAVLGVSFIGAADILNYGLKPSDRMEVKS